ncbi:uncharacterized protein PSFLO_03405 [Pseudozyma flocculosa]|uniref:Secreted protein n=1 Tax=Pseudozyma flocculosa TaxID=84751 RepID=A0A5C3F0G6_9BASI|nr:uncharacterized protein PSFLO_03405 [Pseudozyma flocculosa]
MHRTSPLTPFLSFVVAFQLQSRHLGFPVVSPGRVFCFPQRGRERGGGVKQPGAGVCLPRCWCEGEIMLGARGHGRARQTDRLGSSWSRVRAPTG